eukprot:Skav221695  [mRNA]  locus=scaffold1494:359289:359984:+ [translate_table: standard]
MPNFCELVPGVLPIGRTGRSFPSTFVEVASITKEQADAEEPKDAVLASLKSMDRSFEVDRAAMEKEILKNRKNFYDDGRGSELPPEERVPTPAEIAHQLMQSGDYGNGPPYPIEGTPPPPWRRNGLEGTDNVTIQTDHTVIGKGKSVELIRCFDGKGIERPCGPLYREDVNAEKDEDENLLSGLGYAGILTSGPTACVFQAAVAFLSCRQGLSTSNLAAKSAGKKSLQGFL